MHSISLPNDSMILLFYQIRDSNVSVTDSKKAFLLSIAFDSIFALIKT
nr:MAG TPA: hypothetical protein [Caudoviricetes sp.]